MSVRLLNSAFIRMNNSDKPSKYSPLACDIYIFFFLFSSKETFLLKMVIRRRRDPDFLYLSTIKKETNALPSQWISSRFSLPTLILYSEVVVANVTPSPLSALGMATQSCFSFFRLLLAPVDIFKFPSVHIVLPSPFSDHIQEANKTYSRYVANVSQLKESFKNMLRQTCN